MNEKNKNKINEKLNGFIYKSELAALYHLSRYRFMNKIKVNTDLMDSLYQTGYNDNANGFFPKQTQLIMAEFGVPGQESIN